MGTVPSDSKGTEERTQDNTKMPDMDKRIWDTDMHKRIMDTHKKIQDTEKEIQDMDTE